MLRELKGSAHTASGKRRAARRRTISTIAIVLLVFALLLVSAGLIYVWYIGQHTEVKVTQNKSTLKRDVLPPPVRDDSPVGAAISVFTSPTAPGSNASITVRTKPKAACNIAVTYDKDKSVDSGLIPKTADEYGVVSWSWTIEPNRPVGTWPVDITCALNGKSGYVRGDLVLKR